MIESTLTERQHTHGDYVLTSALSQSLKDVAFSLPRTQPLEPYQKEAIEMILHKIARIINGDSYFIDSWRDIAGYAHLTIDLINKSPKALDTVQQYFKPINDE
ncbi:hypothetical protein ACFBZI_10570 [Moraxella sp. ZJ142]|uniref:hypothetical protein n=1 Tax=Moraxella marmotae TaxID=3344520 RepID=UPI0035D4EA9B